MASFLTLGQLARRFGKSIHQMKYAITTRQIRPSMRIGILRAWSDEALPAIERALAEIAAKKGGN